MRAGWWAAAALAAAAVAGCEGNTAHGAIPRDRFVKANVELRSVPDTAAAGDSLRAAALRKYRVTDRDLARFVRVHGRDPDYLATVWREVADSVQRRYERTHQGGFRQGAPPGMVEPDLSARTDSTMPGDAPPPGVQPGARPPGARRPPKPVLGGRPPAVAPPVRLPQQRTPAPPPDRRRPMAPPGRTVRPPPY
ncbi:MAG TPA: hypothetical protein VFJ82_00315 [Longimicrobium sp.]|nr:hypothetical protein [Longimicrobium sp.]